MKVINLTILLIFDRLCLSPQVENVDDTSTHPWVNESVTVNQSSIS
ncbi:Uncharacterised protein [Yersinia frederiksenii]|jgi:hypothetical protein|uniref:Uncharacterized protein n=1 Tax=Yersinia frederiksenii TaxID=29484 RepID=A0AAI9EQ13_YERFR|nr:Uncharacterised protein [Yersinia frederiksenii]CFR16278.1 Uncharacterised protein [Yersinia frederiksenii]CNF91355.1 Uncharacterised protein [Yersinia frederiksenii]CNK65558.1 Uncharacterised protein [Yersinia frederiksenii]CQH24882.1 Uncharacterised protein [Yersinia frederiksenii]